ncbi:hypothetical protein [Bartonella sp. DGB2]|uniref:hypothetical protein n=1 Tax=Bartonella sp. DGB2 TaxID=3388426 RepID=UPI00398FF7F5
MRTILCLDLGSKMGWAAFCGNGFIRKPQVHSLAKDAFCQGAITSGSVTFKKRTFDGGGVRFSKFRIWLSDTKHRFECAGSSLDKIYYEEVRRHLGTDAAHVYGGFLGVLTAWCEHHQIDYQGVPVGTIKKHATGKGNASKDDVLNAIWDRGHHPEDDNEADALALLYYALDREEEADND